MVSNQRIRFLIVDNDEQESSSLVELFESLGCEASATWSGRDALYQLALDRFDVLLVDQYVADMYVGEFIERVFTLSHHPKVAVMRSSRKYRPIKYNKSLGGCQFLDKGHPERIYQTLRTEIPELYGGPIN